MCHPLFARGLGRYGLECTCSSRGEKRRQGPKHCADTSFRSRFTLIGRRPQRLSPPYDPLRVWLNAPNRGDRAFFYISATTLLALWGPVCLKFLVQAKSFNSSHDFLPLAILPAATERAVCPETFFFLWLSSIQRRTKERTNRAFATQPEVLIFNAFYAQRQNAAFMQCS